MRKHDSRFARAGISPSLSVGSSPGGIFLQEAAAVCTGGLCSRVFVFSAPELRVRDLSQRPAVPGQHLDMLARRRLLKKSVDAPEVNENICFLPDLFTSQLGHMSWQVTRARPQHWPIFPPHGARRPHPRNTAENVPVQEAGGGRPCTFQTEPCTFACGGQGANICGGVAHIQIFVLLKKRCTNNTGAASAKRKKQNN